MKEEVLVIGGGFAGLSTGVALAEAGCPVRLIEQKPYLGGRARSFLHVPTGSTVDNGQHIFMGCYHATLQFLKTIGAEDRVRFQPRLSIDFLDHHSGKTSLACPRLPAPWHLLAGVLGSKSFSPSEKLQVLRFGWALRGGDSRPENFERLTVDAWLKRLGQSERLRRNFWDLLCIAALNEDPRVAAATVFEPVVRLALFQSPEDSRIGLASTGLSECYTEAAASFIRARQGRIEVDRDVAGLALAEEPGNGASRRRWAVRGARLRDGSTIEARTIVCTVPPFQLVRLLPNEVLAGSRVFSDLASMRPAPIISLNFWFDRDITDLEFAGLRGCTIQWLFNRGKILGTGQHHISVVISGAHGHIQREKEELLSLALGELRQLIPEARKARLVHSLVIKERFATFSPTVEAVGFRPSAVTPVSGLFLAGDWTSTSLPATIEGAVKSGYTAAVEVLRADA